MSAPPSFRLLDLQRTDRTHRHELLTGRKIPPAFGNHVVGAPSFRPDLALVSAVNSALAVGAPLLLTGEPGTGKTQVAYYLAWYFDVELHSLDVRSTTTARDLLYEFDSVAYFHAARDPAFEGKKIRKTRFVKKGPLWRALEAPRSAVVLIDEIDKAPRDFPNDLLGALDQFTFKVPEAKRTIRRKPETPPPVVVITSNSERRLPEPFLRRCIFHHIVLSPELLREAVAARRADFLELDNATVDLVVKRFEELRDKSLRKKPATAELLVWLLLLARSEVRPAQLRTPLKDLPGLSALIKDREDLQLLG
jgi:MoxR-like ATPase